MKKIKNILFSLILVLSLVASNYGIIYASEYIETDHTAENVYNENYTVFHKEETKYGTVYYTVPTPVIRERAFWDVVDVVMAGISWADFFNEPSWANFGWAVLDTASILPGLPSTAYFRKGGKVVLKMDEVAKFAKTTKGKKLIQGALKAYKYSDGITSKAIKAINKQFKGKEADKVLNLFKEAANKGFVGPKGQAGIKKLTGTHKKIYTHEIKLKGEYGAYRIFGYKDSTGKYIFDLFEKAHK